MFINKHSDTLDEITKVISQIVCIDRLKTLVIKFSVFTKWISEKR